MRRPKNESPGQVHFNHAITKCIGNITLQLSHLHYVSEEDVIKTGACQL